MITHAARQARNTITSTKNGASQCSASHQSSSGACFSLSRIPVIQRKLAVGASNDSLERKADQIADQVLEAPAHLAVTGAPPHIQHRAEETTEKADTAPASVDRILGSSGRPLGSALQQDMEQRFGHDFSRIPVYARTPVRIQPKLTVSAPGDIYEQEADRVADQVINTREPAIQRQVQSRKAREEGQGIRIRQSADRCVSPVHSMESSEVPTIVHEVLNSSGQPLDSNTRAFFELPFGHDFGRVRVHDDASANTAARALNARAFTVGGDVVFASGEFRTKTAAGRHLLAHELAHVVQQSGGSRPSRSSAELHATEPSIQRDVAVGTMGGSWHTTEYDLVRQEGDRDVTGVKIELHFTPEDPVDAELIGLTQSVRGVRKGSPQFIEDSSKRRATLAGTKGIERGAHIDQPVTANPLYATQETGVDDTLASTPTALPGISLTGEVSELGQHGWHYRDATGTLEHRDAILIDPPLFRDPAKNSSQTFETTALAIQGRQEGTYYGSVRWGWETDASGTLTKIPLSVVAAGVPSATFIRAAELWNAATTSAGAATIDLPTPKVPASATSPSSRSTGGLVIEIARVNEELASISPGTDKTNKEFEKTALEFELAKRPDQPTISLADREAAAALLPTPDLIKRITALQDELVASVIESAVEAFPRLPSSLDIPPDRELEWEAVNREIRNRKLLVTVHVHETEDLFSDNVYVRARSGAAKWSSSVVYLNNGEEHTFIAPLASVFPDLSLHLLALSPLHIEAYDEDVEGNDLMFNETWAWPDLPKAATQSNDGGKYTVGVDFA